MVNSISLETIGIAHTKFDKLENMPIQPTGEKASYGEIEVFPRFLDGLQDIEGFSHIIVIYSFHKVEKVKLKVKPFLDDNAHGVFATRAPVRPNHIGLSVVEVDNVKNNSIFVKNIDVLDGTPILDIKPFIPEFDIPKTKVRVGWINSSSKNVATMVSDDRFK